MIRLWLRRLPTYLAVGFVLFAACAASAPSFAQTEALLLVDADSGKVLYAENATYPWYPASVTKLMTAYVTLRAIKEHKLSLDTLVTVSPIAAAQQPSKMGFKPGIQITIDNALKMMLVKSANDMAVLLAEGVSGSVENFADDMNRAAQRLGMTQTSYVNPNGLPAEGQVTSARDLAILARAIMRDLPEYESYFHIPAIKFGRRTMRNYNSLLGRYPGADGMKTGFICASGFNLVATASRDGKHLIAVVLGAPSGPVRAVKAAQLFERGFSGGTLSWLTTSLGTVDQLSPIAAAPPNLREEMCGRHRKRPSAEHADETERANGGENNVASLLSATTDKRKPSELLGPVPAVVAAAVVYAGPPRGTKAVATESDEDALQKPDGKHKKKAKSHAGKPKSKGSAAKTQAKTRSAAKPAHPKQAAPRVTKPKRKPKPDSGNS